MNRLVCQEKYVSVAGSISNRQRPAFILYWLTPNISRKFFRQLAKYPGLRRDLPRCRFVLDPKPDAGGAHLRQNKPISVRQWRVRSDEPSRLELIREEPLAIRVEGNPYVVVMRTPGDEKAHAAGLCLAEGLVDRPEDIAALAVCEGENANVVTVTLHPAHRKRVGRLLDRRGYISQTSCGLCGKELVQELYQEIKPLEAAPRISLPAAYDCLENLALHQPLRRRTRAAHAAALFDRELEMLAIAEDVGRHNALDKAVGKLFLAKQLERASVLVLSSRISYELVQKAARARIPVILAVSRPTALAVDLASEMKITLASLARGGGLTIYCGSERLIP
jgi:FdhD protein